MTTRAAATETDRSERLARTTTTNDVARVLRRRILEGRYSGEQFIRQEIIAQELGVSRIPVREALALLESEGLVVRVKYRGAIVPKLSASELTEIYELRSLIEPYLLRHAIDNITPAQVAQLRTVIRKSGRADAPSDWASLNVEFHRTLFSAADKPIALQLLDNLLVRADRYLKMQNLRSPATKEESAKEHALLLKRVEARDIDGALEVLRKHIGWNAEDVRHSIGFPTEGRVRRGPARKAISQRR